MAVRLKTAVLCLFAGLMLAFALAVPGAWASSGKGGGDDDDDDHAEETEDRGGDSQSGDGGEGSGGGGDDDGDGTDDSGSSSGSGSDDDSSHNGDSDDSGSSGNSGSSNDDDNSGHGSNSGRGSENSGRERSRLHHDDGGTVEVENNEAGERVRADEAILLTKRDDAASRLRQDGFRIIESFRLEALGATALRVAVPERMGEGQMFEFLRMVDPKGILTFNHIYTPSGRGAIAAGASSAAPVAARKARVGLVDAAVNVKHPKLQRVVVNARSFDKIAHISDAHGTAVASVIADAAPGATVFAAEVFTVASDGHEVATVDTIVRALDWLASIRVPVINLSLTGPANPILESVVKQLAAKGHLLVAAVGNEGPRGAPQFPAAYDGVIGVTAVDRQHNVYLYANHGDYVDFAAPGVDLEVADKAGAVETA